jgi:predicted O-methyltransferase YrrM
MPIQESFESAVQRYNQITRSGNVTITQEEIKDLVNAAKMYLETISQREASGEIDELGAAKFRIILRNRAKSLLNSVISLDSVTERLLKEFILDLPEYFPGKWRFTADYFSMNIESWECDLARFAHKPQLNFLEVGSFEGRSACWLLENILTDDSCTITCIDTFDFAGQGIVHLQDAGVESMSIEERFDYNINAAGGTHKVRKLFGCSQEMLRSLPFSTYDYIYIDGSHKAVNVLEDAVLAWPLLKKGGMLNFDDYYFELDPNPINRPRMAIDAFLSVYEAHYKLIRKDNQVTIEKLSA